ncbi:ABC transporter substrate-binding protein [Breznakiellaceae bacterium SP9]
MMQKRALLLFIPIGVLVFLIFGPKSNQAAFFSDPASITLKFSYWWQDELDVRVLSDLVEEFEGKNPAIHVELDPRSYREVRELAFESGLNADSVPLEPERSPQTHIIALDPLWVHDLIEHKRLEPLTLLKAAPDPPMLPAPADLPQASEVQWFVPFLAFMYPLYYNIEILKNAGFSRPPKTLTDFLNYSKAISNNGRWGTSFALSPDNYRALYGNIFPWIWASGQSLYLNGKPNFSGRPLIETLDFIMKLMDAQWVSPGSFSKTEQQKLADFTQGKIGLMIASIQDMEQLQLALGDNLGITTIPVPDTYAGKPRFSVSSWSLGILRDAANKDEATAFIRFLAEHSDRLAGRTVPGNGVHSRNNDNKDPLYTKAWDMYEAGEDAQDLLGKPKIREFESIVLEELGRFLSSPQAASSSADTAAAIQKRLESALEM